MALRKNVASLQDKERNLFVTALKRLKAAPSRMNPPATSRYDDYVYIHMQAMLVISITDPAKPVRNGNWTTISDMRMPMWAHRCPAFLPWHRELLRQFELDLQSVTNKDLGLPYWDWSVSQDPANLPWSDDFLGGDGHDDVVRTGPFAGKANWELTLSEDGASELVRGFGLDPVAPRLPSAAEVVGTLGIATYDASPWSDRKSLATFRNQLEGWHTAAGSPLSIGMHNLVHVWVGGTKGTMLPSTSPNDPVFFLHHCNIDRLWSVWQQQHPTEPHYLPTEPLPNDPGQSLNEPMIFYDQTLSSTPPWGEPFATPASVIDHTRLGYAYDTDPDHGAETVARAQMMEKIKPKEQRALEVTETDPLKFKKFKIRPRDHFRRRLEELVDEQAEIK